MPLHSLISAFVIRLLESTVKPVLIGHLKIDKTKVLKTNGTSMKVEHILECSPWSILQYFWPALSAHWYWNPILVFFLSDHLGQVFSSRFCVCSLLPGGHLKGKGWPLDSCWWRLSWFCYFPIWYPVTGMVLDCINSWSLLSFLLSHLVSCDLMKVERILECSPWSILQYFWPALSAHWCWNPILEFFFSGHLGQFFGLAFASVHYCLVVTWRERADLLTLVGDVYRDFVTFPFGILGQVWYLIVSIPDPCCLSYFYCIISKLATSEISLF